MARVVQNGVLTVAQEYTAGLLRIGLANALPVFVLLVQEEDLEHHFHGRGLIEIEVELLEDLELRLHEHLGDEFDSRLLLAKVGRLLEVEDTILMHLHAEAEAHHRDE